MSRFALASLLTLCLISSAQAANPIEEENQKPGALDWQLTRVRVDGSNYRSTWVEGYCSKQSVSAGDSIDIMISADPPRPVKVEIFRTGYYDGRGARLMKTIEPIDCSPQPTPKPGPKDLHECHWKPSTSLTIPDDWVSGVYLG
ncbi:MAG TPA: N,N-dimethylformamidase beta subunit family domain-containing protein, partial [Isosphaeraceae bacterium]|nr:N,N-dimethylformamidase beta subunit family domain-containing protein [Isosphaeraceae bacterium]